METVEEMWARMDAQDKSKYEKLVAAKVDDGTDAYKFIELLCTLTDLYIIIGSFCDEDTWEKKFETYNFQCSINKFGRYNDVAKKIIVEKLNKCDNVIGRGAVAMTFYNIRNSIEQKRPHIHYITGAEEARECNRQFRSMMSDNDAWENID